MSTPRARAHHEHATITSTPRAHHAHATRTPRDTVFSTVFHCCTVAVATVFLLFAVISGDTADSAGFDTFYLCCLFFDTAGTVVVAFCYF